MRAVWSYWTKPMRVAARNIWLHDRGHWLSWVLSVETARRHYPDVALVTDSDGARILVEELGLQFGDVSTELDTLAEVDPSWWAIGKLVAYRAQRVPFVHIDADAYLWNRLPPIVEQAPVLAQSPEAILAYRHYEPERLHALFERKASSVPEPWTWYLRHGPRTAACCGIVGGQDVELLHGYAELAIDLALNPRYRAAWEGENLQQHMIFIEQYLVCAYVEYRRTHPIDGRSVYLQYLFPDARFDRVAEVGYSHVIGDAKRSRQALDRIEEVVRRDYPALHRRCVEYSERAAYRRAAG